MTLAIIALSIWIYSLKKELKETEQVLEQCSDRYYELIGKKNPRLSSRIKTNNHENSNMIENPCKCMC